MAAWQCTHIYYVVSSSCGLSESVRQRAGISRTLFAPAPLPFCHAAYSSTSHTAPFPGALPHHPCLCIYLLFLNGHSLHMIDKLWVVWCFVHCPPTPYHTYHHYLPSRLPPDTPPPSVVGQLGWAGTILPLAAVRGIRGEYSGGSVAWLPIWRRLAIFVRPNVVVKSTVLSGLWQAINSATNVLCIRQRPSRRCRLRMTV